MIPWPRRLRNIIIRALIRAISLLYPPVHTLFSRIRSSPGVPIKDPSTSYWTLCPSPISRHGADGDLPKYADIVVIGSGITGTSFARAILDYDALHGVTGKPLCVLMLEARDVCSGATGRNGGHITPMLYRDYTELKAVHGIDMARKIIRFRLSHFQELLSVATEENLLEESQCREVEALDAFYEPSLYNEAKGKLETYKKDLPEESSRYQIYEGSDEIKNLQLSRLTVGCMSTRGGAVHPYHLVTGILARLLRVYPSNFYLFSHTPCTSISGPESAEGLYSLETPKGTIQTPHVVHATNAWASHLIPGMREKIIPARGVMTAQGPRPGLGEGSKKKRPTAWTGQRSFVFYPSNSFDVYDYLTQQPAADSAVSIYPKSAGELMFGGGFGRDNGFLTEVGNVDDRGWNSRTASYLQGALSDYFKVDDNDSKEEVKATWGGILGISVDQQPWVGRIPATITSRGSVFGGAPTATNLAAPGEWMAAGYTGEGMVHAWQSGKALAYMVLGIDEGGILDWLPEVFRISEERWKEVEIEDLIASFLNL